MRALLATALTVGALGVLTSPSSAADPTWRDNAALYYWQAFHAMPRYKDLTEDEKLLLDNYEGAPLDKIASDFVQRYRRSLKFIQRGAACKECIWGLPLEDGPDLIIEHVQHTRNFLAPVVVRARFAFAAGQPQAAFDDMLDLMTMARHLNPPSDSILVSQLVQYAIENTLTDQIAEHCYEDPAALRHALTRYNALPPSMTVADIVRREQEVYLEWILREPKAATDMLLREVERAEGKLARWRAELTLRAKGLNDLCREMAQLYGESAKLAAGPRDQFDKASAEFDKKLQAAPPMARAFIPAINKLYHAEVRTEARRALLRAGLTLVSASEAEFKKIKDPFGDGPFELEKKPGGYELRSKHKDVGGQPVTMFIRTEKE